MSIDFPSPATNGQTHAAAGATWKYDGAKWISYSSTFEPGPYLPLTGGTLSGQLTVNANVLAYDIRGGDYYSNGYRIINSDASYVHVFAADNVVAEYLGIGDSYYDNNIHHFRRRSDGYQAVSITPGGSQPLKLNSPNGTYNRIETTVDGARTWAVGTRNDGYFSIADLTAGADRLVMDTGSGYTTLSTGINIIGDVTANVITANGRIHCNNNTVNAYNISEGFYTWAPQGGNSRVWTTVQNVRTWSCGTLSSGPFAIADESVAAIRFLIDTGGGSSTQGNPFSCGNLSCGTINAGQVNGSVGSFSSNIWTSDDVYAQNGIRCKQGISGGFGGNRYFYFWSGVLEGWVDSTYCGIVQFSDYRMKKDIELLPSMWERVKALRPISYTRRDFTPPSAEASAKERGTPFVPGDDIERWGFAAHELQETLTVSAATGVKDSPDTLQYPDPFTVIAALTRALQEALTRIEALEAKLA